VRPDAFVLSVREWMSGRFTACETQAVGAAEAVGVAQPYGVLQSSLQRQLYEILHIL
jgi:hypothetical protein